ncbi:hypothetical protein HHK36_020458 [Tetracentron sinense]|uniref:Uncharacterized protein n=1 Tax=Tetracentron sinense TaxID=13715 RepID=A0A834YZ15_TETSI|nr:hypothetical protein HHK36_020458 [Tetracentron sinense]
MIDRYYRLHDIPPKRSATKHDSHAMAATVQQSHDPLTPTDLASPAPPLSQEQYQQLLRLLAVGANPPLANLAELSFGYVSYYSSNTSCSSNSTLSPLLLSFTRLRKLFFYKCFTQTEVSFPENLSKLGSTLEELVFIVNSTLVGTLSGKIGNLTSLRRLVMIGTRVFGKIPDEIRGLFELEEITITRNRFKGEVSLGIGKLKKVKVLDLSYNGFEGNLLESIGEITKLLKLDLGSNRFNGKIPETLQELQRLEFLDLSYNRFANFGILPFLGKMSSLKEVYLSGNPLGGQIPEILEKLGGFNNNKLEGNVPVELGLLECVNEMNMDNNQLSGRLAFSAKIGGNLILGITLTFVLMLS